MRVSYFTIMTESLAGFFRKLLVPPPALRSDPEHAARKPH